MLSPIAVSDVDSPVVSSSGLQEIGSLENPLSCLMSVYLEVTRDTKLRVSQLSKYF